MTEIEYYALRAVQPLLDQLSERIKTLETKITTLETEIISIKADSIRVTVKEAPALNLDNHSPEEWMAAVREAFFKYEGTMK